MHIAIIGGGFGGLNAAINLGKKLKHTEHTVTVIADHPQFIFRPSLIWVPFHNHSIEKLSFPLRSTFEKVGVTFLEKRVQAVMPKQNYIVCEKDEVIEYDFLIIASGALPDWEQISGLKGRSASIYDVPSALETRRKLSAIEEGESIVIGAARGNPNPGIAYEFLFECEAYLNERSINCPLTFFTFENNLFEGKGKAPTENLEQIMKKKNIPYSCGVSIERVDHDTVYFTNGKQFSYLFLLLLPPYKGREFIFSSHELEHENGILPVRNTLQSIQSENIYIVGDANNLNVSKSGRTAEMQGKHAAQNIIRQIKNQPIAPFQDDTLYIMELGTEGAMLVQNKQTAYTKNEVTMSGLMPHMMKRTFETYYRLKFS